MRRVQFIKFEELLIFLQRISVLPFYSKKIQNMFMLQAFTLYNVFRIELGMKLLKNQELP